MLLLCWEHAADRTCASTGVPDDVLRKARVEGTGVGDVSKRDVIEVNGTTPVRDRGRLGKGYQRRSVRGTL